MSRLFNLIKGGAGQERVVGSVLNRLDKGKVPVRMEIENSQYRFKTVLAFKRNTVVVAKPPALGEELKKGGMVRFKVPGGGNQAIRMEVATPHFNLTNGNPVFLCKPPVAFCEGLIRSADRFDTSRFSNLLLETPHHPEHFRILDLAMNGCRIIAKGGNILMIFPPGERMDDGKIRLGNKVSVELENHTPRSHHGQSVGLEFEVSNVGNNTQYLTHLISSLEKVEAEQNRAEMS